MRNPVRYSNGVPTAESFRSSKGTPLIVDLNTGTLYVLLPGNVVQAIGGGGGTSDHGALAGLSDDDHSQYHNDTRGDARYYTQAQVDSAMSGKASTSHNHDGTYEPANANIQSHIGSTANPHSVTKAQVGLGNADNTSDANKPISTATQTALDGKSSTSHHHDAAYDAIGAAAAAYASAASDLSGHVAAADPHTGYQKESEKGQANGYAGLGAGGLVPMSQLASGTPDGTKYVRDDGTLATPPSGSGPTKISGNTGAFSGDTTWETLSANSADVTTTTQTTVMTVTGLDAGTYRIKGALIYQTAATTTGIGITLNHTGTVTRFVSYWTQVTTGGAAATGIADQVTSTAAGQLVEGKAERAKDTRSSFTVGVDTANADELAIIDALIVVTVSGDLQIKIATEVAASAVRLMAGSTIEINKVA